MKNSKIASRTISIIYGRVLPAFAVLFLLIVSQFIKRPWFLGSFGLDLFARIWVTFSFCVLYIRLSDLDQYMFKMYRIEMEDLNNDALPLNWRNVFWGVLGGVMSIPLTWWVIQFFLPSFSSISGPLAFLHGLLISIPIIIRRNQLVL
jgi:hypothetical protein